MRSTDPLASAPQLGLEAVDLGSGDLQGGPQVAPILGVLLHLFDYRLGRFFSAVRLLRAVWMAVLSRATSPATVPERPTSHHRQYDRSGDQQQAQPGPAASQAAAQNCQVSRTVPPIPLAAARID